MPTPYFRRGSGAARRRGAATKIAAAARGRLVRKARGEVKKIYKKPFVPVTFKRDSAISSLSRSVKQLQNQQLGAYQKQLQHANITLGAAGFDRKQPMCFAANCFASPIPSGGSAADYPDIWKCKGDLTPGSAGRFAIWQNSTGQQGIPDKFNTWSGCNDDEVSHNIYQPLSASYRFSFNMDMKPSDEDVYIRIDVLKPRKVLRTSTDHEYNLPQSLPGFAYLAENAMVNRNRINTTYWGNYQVKTKWIKMSATKDLQADSDRKVTRRAGFNLKFNQILKPDLDQLGTTGHQWYLNTQVKHQVWVVISTSHDIYATNPSTPWGAHDTMQIERRIAWRDQHGTST